jgi:hypothetical protein
MKTAYRYFLLNITLILGLLVSFSVESALADKIDFEVSADRNVVAVGQGLKLQLKFENSKNVPSPRLDGIEGFQSRYIGPSTMMSIVNGRVTSSVTHIYSLIPLKTGKFRIGPFSFDYKGDTYTSNSLEIEVVDSHAAGGPSTRHRGAEQVINDRIFLVMEAGKSKAYLNEMIPLTIKLYINSLSLRDIEHPLFEHEGISVGEFEEPRQYQERRGGLLYDVIEFKTKIFATRAGGLSIGPAKVKGNLLIKNQRHRRPSIFDDFFGGDPFGDFFGYEKYPVELSSERISLDILPLPAEGRPDDFKGAVGSFGLSLEASPVEVMAGDPVTLKLSITGDGNFDTVTAPVLKGGEGFKTYEPQVTKGENNKVFEQVLIPGDETITKLPDVYFSFFDPEEAEYKTLVKKDIPLKVLKPEKEEELMIFDAPQTVRKRPVKEKLGRDIIYIKESPGRFRARGAYLYKYPLFYIIQALPLILFLFLRALKRKKERLTSDIGYARRLSAPGKAKKGLRDAAEYLKSNSTEDFYGAVSKTIREYLGDRFNLSSGGMTIDVVDGLLRDKGISDEMLHAIKMIFQECDIARYSSAGLGKAEMEATLTRLKEVINFCERLKI